MQSRPIVAVAGVDIGSPAKEGQYDTGVPVPGGYVKGCLGPVSTQYVDVRAGFHEGVHHLSLARASGEVQRDVSPFFVLRGHFTAARLDGMALRHGRPRVPSSPVGQEGSNDLDMPMHYCLMKRGRIVLTYTVAPEMPIPGGAFDVVRVQLVPTPIGSCSTIQQSQDCSKVSSLGGDVKRCYAVGVEGVVALFTDSDIHINICAVARQ